MTFTCSRRLCKDQGSENTWTSLVERLWWRTEYWNGPYNNKLYLNRHMVRRSVSQSVSQSDITYLYYLDVSKLPKSTAVEINHCVEFRMKCSGSKFSTQNNTHIFPQSVWSRYKIHSSSSQKYCGSSAVVGKSYEQSVFWNSLRAGLALPLPHSNNNRMFAEVPYGNRRFATDRF
jgi:hypothetical protein